MYITSSPYKVIEGYLATLVCTVTSANPNTDITWKWTKTDGPNTILHHKPWYFMPHIQREKSGLYTCTATNSVGTSNVAVINVDVLRKCFQFFSFISHTIPL